MSDQKYRYHPYDARDKPRYFREPFDYRGYKLGQPYEQGPLDPQRDISEKQMREKPSRTLFVRNISYDTKEEDLKQLFEKFGPVRKIFNLIRKRGMAFVTFYDMRHADKAKRELQNHILGDRPIDIHYSLPKEDDGRHFPDEDDDQYTGTLFVSVRGTNETFTNADLRKHFEQWGDVREVRDCRNSSHQKFVEFWDVRDAQKVLAQHQGSKFRNGTLELRMAYQQRPPMPKTEHSLRPSRNVREYDSYERSAPPPLPPSGPILPPSLAPSVNFQGPLSATSPLNAPGSVPSSTAINPALLNTLNPQLLSLLINNMQNSVTPLIPSTAVPTTTPTGGLTVPLSPISQSATMAADNTPEIANQLQQLLYLVSSTQAQNQLTSSQPQLQPQSQSLPQSNQWLQLQQLMTLLNPTTANTSGVQPQTQTQPQQLQQSLQPLTQTPSQLQSRLPPGST